jgi:hypothetical protein
MPEIENRRFCSGPMPDFRLTWWFCRSAPTRSLCWHQATSEQVQVRQRKGGEQARGVLGQSAVTNFGKSPQMLDDPKGVLTASSGLGANLIDVALIIRERPRLGAATVDPIADPLGQRRLTMRLAPVGLVAKHLCLIPVQQLVHLADVGLRRIGGDQAVHDAAFVCVNTGCVLHVRPGDANVKGNGNWAETAGGVIIGRGRVGTVMLCDQGAVRVVRGDLTLPNLRPNHGSQRRRSPYFEAGNPVKVWTA